jgi:hypothetical protein
VDGVYTFDDNGNLFSTGVMTNVWDAANRLTEVSRNNYTLRPIYNGLGDRVAQVSNGITTTFALDVQGLPEVIYTGPSAGSGQVGNAYLHLPGVIVAEKAGEKPATCSATAWVPCGRSLMRVGLLRLILIGNEKGANPIAGDRTRMTRIERIYAEKAISFIKNQ